jgi:hypothetical protein
MRFRNKKDEEVFQNDFMNNKVDTTHVILLVTSIVATGLLISFTMTHKVILQNKSEKDEEYDKLGLHELLEPDLFETRESDYFAFNIVNSFLIFFTGLWALAALLKLIWIDRKAVSPEIRRVRSCFKKEKPQKEEAPQLDERYF